MSHTLRVDIVSAEAEIFSGDAQLVVATGEMGELGIAPRHAPLITRLKPGHVDVVLANGERQQFWVSGGILEVQPQVVTVLADTAARGPTRCRPARGQTAPADRSSPQPYPQPTATGQSDRRNRWRRCCG